ncbi:MAG: hypothetical protein QM723_09735 [Myxococcaceae bacterium]
MIGLLLVAVLAQDGGTGEGAPEPTAAPKLQHPESIGPAVEVLPLLEFRHTSLGPFLSAEIGTSTAGYQLTGNLGFQVFGLTSTERKYLLIWDAQVAFRPGGLARTHTNELFLGGEGDGTVSLHHRVSSKLTDTWCPVVGVGAGAGLLVAGTPGTPLSQLDTINSVDGYGGIVPYGTLRIAAGFSWLKSRHAFLIEAVGQELLRGSGVVAPFAAFSEGGLSARYDIAGSLSLIGEAFYGVTPENGYQGLHAHYQSRRLSLDLKARKTFANRWWAGAFFGLSQEGASVTYEQQKTTFTVNNAPVFRFGLSVGLPLGGEP